MIEIAHESRLQSLEDKTICSLSLAIRLRVRNGCVIYPSALSGTKVPELFRVKVGTIVCNDTVGDSISEHNPLYELDSRTRVQLLDRFCLDPFGELVDCY